MESDEETKVETILTFIDTKISGVEVLNREVDLASFVAGYTQQIIKMKEFEDIFSIIRQKILHLSYLVHLVCKYENFDSVYEEYKANLDNGTIDWNDDIDVSMYKEDEEDSVPEDDTFHSIVDGKEVVNNIKPAIKSEEDSVSINFKSILTYI